MPMNIFEALQHMEERPKMYFLDPISMALIESWVFGYMTAANAQQLECNNGLRFEYFDSWLTGTIPKTLPENRGWRRRIEHISTTNEQSIQIFFDLIKKFATGKLNIEKIECAPQTLQWSRGNGSMKFEEFQQIEEIIVRFEIWYHEFSQTVFRMGYNENNFLVYVEPTLGDKKLRTLTYTQTEENF